jgi:hypothetical protein
MKLNKTKLFMLVMVFLSMTASKCTPASDGTYYVQVKKAEIFTTVNRFDATQLNAVFSVGGKSYTYALAGNDVLSGCYHLVPLAANRVNVPMGVDGVATWYGFICPDMAQR